VEGHDDNRDIAPSIHLPYTVQALQGRNACPLRLNVAKQAFLLMLVGIVGNPR
jgi:hypothetical protein